MFKNLLDGLKILIFEDLTKNYDQNPFLTSDLDDMINMIKMLIIA